MRRNGKKNATAATAVIHSDHHPPFRSSTFGYKTPSSTNTSRYTLPTQSIELISRILISGCFSGVFLLVVFSFSFLRLLILKIRFMLLSCGVCLLVGF